MSARIGSSAPIRHRSVAAALSAVLAVVVLAAASCSSDDDSPAATPAPVVSIAPTVSTVAPTTTSVTTTTLPPGPPLSERLALVEVSVRLDAAGAPERILSISVGGDTLSAVADEGAEATPVWCSGVLERGADGLVVRVGPPAIDGASRGIERFELVADDAVVGAPSPAEVTLVVDGATIVADGEVRVLDEAARSGAFSGAAPDGTTVEGAFRCA